MWLLRSTLQQWSDKQPAPSNSAQRLLTFTAAFLFVATAVGRQQGNVENGCIYITGERVISVCRQLTTFRTIHSRAARAKDTLISTPYSSYPRLTPVVAPLLGGYRRGEDVKLGVKVHTTINTIREYKTGDWMVRKNKNKTGDWTASTFGS